VQINTLLTHFLLHVDALFKLNAFHTKQCYKTAHSNTTDTFC